MCMPHVHVHVHVSQMAGNLWHPLAFLRKTVDHLMHAYPYWNRSAGTDHVFFLTTDRGGCWKPWATQHSIIISYLGFRASEVRRHMSWQCVPHTLTFGDP